MMKVQRKSTPLRKYKNIRGVNKLLKYFDISTKMIFSQRFNLMKNQSIQGQQTS